MATNIHPDDEDMFPAPEKVGDYITFLSSELTTLRWILAEFMTKTTRRWSLGMLTFLTGMSALSIATPLIIAMVINGHVAGDSGRVYMGFVLFVGSAALLHVFSFGAGLAREWVLGLSHCRMDERITELLFEKPLGQHERHATRLNHSSIDKGYWKVLSLQENIIFQGIPAVLLSSLALIGLWIVSPLVWLVGSVLTVLYIGWSLWLNYQVGKTIHPIEREFRRINRMRTERWEKINRVVTNGIAREEGRSLSRAMHDNMNKDCRFWIWFIGQSDVRSFLLQRIFQAGALGYGSWLVYSGEWGIGLLFPLLMWVDILVSNLLQLGNVERRIGQDIIPVQLMIEALSIRPAFDTTAGEAFQRDGPISVEFENVSYDYTNGRDESEGHSVLQDITFAIAPGEKVALLGPSGAGKTTIMKLLLRFDDPTRGQILVGGKPLRDVHLASFMHQVGYIPQQAQILDGTIGENLLYGVSLEEKKDLCANQSQKLWELMRSLKIDFGKRLTFGLDTLVGRHGLKLSGGQSQRVMIGAAVAKRPRLMVIDEATSNLDSTTEREVQEGLAQALSHGTTALVVAHRLSTVRRMCDRFIVLRPIEEVSSGESQIEAVADSFEDLWKISPTFRKLAEDQGVAVKVTV